MSNPLDVVHLFDAKVAAVAGTVARSKKAVVSAKEDLDKHQRWLERHRVLCARDLKRHQRRLQRRRAIEACKHIAISVVLLVPSLCGALLHGSIQALIFLYDLISISCSWAGAKARALGLWLIGLLSRGFSWVGVKAHAFGIWLIGLLSIGFSWAGAKARALGLSLFGLLTLSSSWARVQARAFGLWLIGLLSCGFSWIGVKCHGIGLSLIELLSISCSRIGVKAPALVLSLEEIVARQFSQLLVRLGFHDDARGGTRDTSPAGHLDEHRLQEAAFARLRSEHERLQTRIHALDKHYGRRVVSGGQASGASNQEWVQLRELARNAARLFDMQERHLLDSAVSRGSGRPSVVDGTGPLAPIRSLQAGHAVYEAPALARRDDPRAAPRCGGAASLRVWSYW